jgi:hydrogenase-4 component E
MLHLIDSPYQVAHLLDTGVLVLSFMLLVQRRLFTLLKLYGLQACVLAAAAAWEAYIQDAPHLYITAVIALFFKGMIIPFALTRIVVKLDIHRNVETAMGTGPCMLLGVAIVALSISLVFPVAASAGAITRENLAIALSVVMLGFLIMITRHNAVSQVVGFMSLENGLILAAVGVKGMPLVVELSIAFSVMVAFIIFGIFFFHIRERFDTLDINTVDRIRMDRFTKMDRPK